MRSTGSELWVPLGDGRQLRVPANLVKPGSGPVPSSMSPLSLTYVVDAGFGAATPNGSAGAPYPTITAGIAALIAAGGAGVGGTLLIVGGDYSGEADITLLDGEWGFVAYSPSDGQPEPVTLPRIITNAAAGAVVILDGCNFDAGVECAGLTTQVRTFESSGTFDDTAGNLRAQCSGGARGTLRPSVTGSAFSLQAFGMAVNDFSGFLDGQTSTFDDCEVSGALTNNGASGGSHLNEPWRFSGCSFALGTSLVAGQPGAAFDVFMDRASANSFWASGGTRTGNVIIIEDSLVPASQFRATDETATSTTNADQNWHAITGGNFTTSIGGSPWVLGAAAQAEYQAAYAGLGVPPATPRQRIKVTINASISTAAATHISMAVDQDQDLIGQAIGTTGGIQETATPAAGAMIHLSCQRVVDVAPGAVSTVQPAFGCRALAGAQDVIIHHLDYVIEPYGPTLQGW